ncbi:MAG: glutamine amidotransferase-related protein [Euzebya sp.]
MTVLVVQHLPHEHAGVLGEVLVRAGVSTVTWRAWAQPEMPGRLQEYRAVTVLGGDMFTDESDHWPHLNAVRDLLTQAVQADIPSLCLCLGAQLLAEACGRRVSHGTPEIG